MAITHVTALRNTLANAAVDALDAAATAGKLVIRDGTTVLATVVLDDPAFDAAAAGVAALAGVPLDEASVATGDADNFLATDGDDNLCWSGSVTATGGGGDLTLDTVTVSSIGQVVTITGLSYTAPP